MSVTNSIHSPTTELLELLLSSGIYRLYVLRNAQYIYPVSKLAFPVKDMGTGPKHIEPQSKEVME